MFTNKTTKKDIIVYHAKDNRIEFRGDFQHETIWATQAEIAAAFNVTPQNVTMHIRRIYKDKELLEKATCKESLQVQTEGNRQVKRKLKEYNLDVIIAVGYRINSIVGTQFRQWATKTLRDHVVQGYTINHKQIAKNYKAFMQAVSDVQQLLPEQIEIDPKMVLDLIKEFASTWVALDAYDRESFVSVGSTKKSIILSAGELSEAIAHLRTDLIKKGEATELFAKEKSKHGIEGIIGNVMQSFGGKPLYKTVEEKAAHLLYFMVKNHPFVDGNKRSGAFAFIWFLKKTCVKGGYNITPSALTAITLLIAESSPKKKDQMIGLIVILLNKKQ
ncbi:MAG: death-on-curing protein [Candidatus Magasanikbacteria bacterium CG10_big_fil_rev_8_21_14_0_10_43_6]|uniref:Death-on-curing protein n=1 Tax=Candidatus Magasanikbacteria bacterium CG10_big_fil_rev_8_21_14_0_10_43_6 TaxID=1974650 RepID=A0A2M6W1P5_9BACT|nr:MAG: death-on-curing protein [Candidatus Magasanikbacteria bacterium CG10_big_fil_rev_8_21_14_0_10_43_6]